MLATMDAVEGLPAPNREGRQLGKYHLIAELARGGMGVVFLALVRGPAGFHKLFVVKELRTHLAEDPELVSMFLEEARLAAKLSHPNVVQTIEVGSEGGRHFIAMEHLDGQSYGRVLARLRKSGLSLPLAGHLHVLSQVLEGLQYAHSRGEFGALKPSVVHRDMSPQNILLTFDGQVKIIDFGIAKSLESSSETRTGVLKGKLSYMAPEQAAGEPPDGRSDVFSVGVMLWEAVVGTRMWNKAHNDMRILHALTRGEIPRPAEDKPDIDADLERIILRATAPKARDRYASASEFQADIENHLRWLAEPQFGSREIQKLLGAAFAEERASTKALVDAELRSPSTPDAATDSALFGRGSGPPAPSVLPAEPGVTQTYQTSLEQLASQHTRREGKAGGGRNRAARIAVTVAVAGSLVAGGTWLLERNQSDRRVEAATMAPPVASVEASAPGTDSVGAATVARPSPGTASPMPQSTGAALRPEAPTAPRSILPWPRRAPPPPPAPTVAGVTPSNAAPSTAAGPSPAEPVSQKAAPDSPAPSSGHVKKQIDTRDPYAD